MFISYAIIPRGQIEIAEQFERVLVHTEHDLYGRADPSPSLASEDRHGVLAPFGVIVNRVLRLSKSK